MEAHKDKNLSLVTFDEELEFKELERVNSPNIRQLLSLAYSKDKPVVIRCKPND